LRRSPDCELDLLLVWDRSSSVATVRDTYTDISKELVQNLIIGPHYTQVHLLPNIGIHPILLLGSGCGVLIDELARRSLAFE